MQTNVLHLIINILQVTMNISIDASSGFCWGVVRTIDIVEKTLDETKDKQVYVLGDIIHNPREIERLSKKGLKTIKREEIGTIDPLNSRVLIRAHGEPPSTFETAKALGVELVDATCPLVTALQKRVYKYYKEGWQIVIYGKPDHAEIIGLRGFCDNECIVIRSVAEALATVDFTKKTVLLSQTTMDRETFLEIRDALKANIEQLQLLEDDGFMTRDTICKYVSGREDALREFARSNDIVLFVAGKNSSNGKILYNVAKSANENIRFIEDIKDIDYGWFEGAESVGITGATSTPQWYMELVKSSIEKEILQSA